MEEHSTTEMRPKAQKIIAVMGGKGGVGKSTIAGLLAVSLRRQGYSVGILDGDLTSPAVVHMFGTDIQLTINEQGNVEPLISNDGVKIMSMNVFQENANEPLVWRGPMISSAFKQFYSDIDWGNLDYLIVDVPTGTSDVPITVLHSLPLDGIILVSSPHKLATAMTEKCVAMIQQVKKHIIGVVENMAYFTAPHGEYYELFGPSSAGHLTTMTHAPLLAQIPFDPELAARCDTGQIEGYKAEVMNRLIADVLAALTSVE